MKKTLKIAAIAAVAALIFAACGDGYKTTDSGLKYKFISQNKDGEQVKIGDVLIAELVVSFDTMKLDSIKGEPKPLFKADTMYKDYFNRTMSEGFLMMHVGDEVEFALNADSLQPLGMRMPDIYKAGEGQLMKFRLKLHEVKTEEQLMQEQQEKMERLKGEEQPAREKYIADNNITAKPTADGLYIIPIEKGNGPKVQDGKQVTVNYTGRLLDGTVFDSSDPTSGFADAHDPISYVVGQQPMIRGWEEAVKTMRQGDKVRIIVPSDLGYGAYGGGPIPPYATLVFDIEVLTVAEPQQAANPQLAN